jgi:ABC-type phosphate transport system substrate-binding protein
VPRISTSAATALFFAGVLGVVSSLFAAEHAPAFVVIVNPQMPQLSGLDRRFLANAFLKKAKEWPDGEAIHPVDLPQTSSTRERFSEEVLHRSTRAVKAYWQQQIFSGRDVPPPELESDEAVVAYVLAHRGAIGYVSGVATLKNARVMRIE